MAAVGPESCDGTLTPVVLSSLTPVRPLSHQRACRAQGASLCLRSAAAAEPARKINSSFSRIRPLLSLLSLRIKSLFSLDVRALPTLVSIHGGLALPATAIWRDFSGASPVIDGGSCAPVTSAPVLLQGLRREALVLPPPPFRPDMARPEMLTATVACSVIDS